MLLVLVAVALVGLPNYSHAASWTDKLLEAYLATTKERTQLMIEVKNLKMQLADLKKCASTTVATSTIKTVEKLYGSTLQSQPIQAIQTIQSFTRSLSGYGVVQP